MGRYVGHICDNYYRKPSDDVFEYCKCGARYFVNRRKRPFDSDNYKIEESNEL